MLVRVVLLLLVILVGPDWLGHDAELGILGPWALWDRYRLFLIIEADRAPTTISRYRHIIRDTWFPYLEGQRKWWDKANKRDLARFLDRPTRSGRALGERLAPNTRSQYGQAVKNLYTFAHEAEYIRKNPMASFKVPRGGQPVIRSFSLAQLRDILTSAATLDDRTYLIAALEYGAGLRAAEIAALRIEDISLDGRGWLLVHGKGRKDRTLPLGPEVRAAIVRSLAERGMPRVGPLVVSRGVRPGEPMTPDSISRVMSNHIRKHCGIDGSGHGLRHSFAMELIRAAGEDKLLTVSRMLGHADTRVTDRTYLRGWQGDPEHVIDKLPFPARGVRKQ